MSLGRVLRQLFNSSIKSGLAKDKRARRQFHLEQLEWRQLLAANLAANVIDYSESRVIVRFEGQLKPTDIVSSMLQNDVVLSESGNVHRFDLRGGFEMDHVLAALSSATGVIYAQADRRIQSSVTPNDPSFSQLWGLNSTSDVDIDAPEAWDTQRGSASTLVAIIDTGIDYNHVDLAANIWTNPGEIAGNGRDDDGNGYVDDIHGYDFANNDSDPMDDNEHGTHVAGTIGAVGNNGIGVTGVNWNVKMMALKFLDASGSGYDSDAIRALDYAVRMGAKVSNNSWGGGGSDPALADAINRARTAGHIFVAAAGNEGANNDVTPNYPSNYNYDNIIAVAAVGSTDALPSWSNYGATTVDIAAPGVSILSTLPGNQYGRLSGTSMATPHVTGVVALVMSQFPTYTYRQVIDKVLASVDKLPQLNGKVATGGRLNAAKAVAGTVTNPPPTIAPGPYAIASTVTGSANGITSVVTQFDKAIDPTSVSIADIASFASPTGASLLSTVTGITVNGSYVTVSFASLTQVGRSKLVLGPDIRDLAGNRMNQDRDGTAGEATEDRWNTSFSVGGTFSVASTQQVAIPDRRTITSKLVVNRDVRIADLNVMVNLTHTYDSDLQITLTSPSGKTITLVNRRGGSGDNFNSTLFDDEATRSITSGSAPFSGSYRPESALSAYDTLSGLGTWTLTISDLATRDTGTLRGWSLNFTSYDALAGGGGAASISVLPSNSSDTKNGASGNRPSMHIFAFREDPAVPVADNLALSIASSLDRVMADLAERANTSARRMFGRR